MNIAIKEQAIRSCNHLLSEINRDRTTATFGCLDRRYWAWKLTDFPEATYQRNLSALSWYLHQRRDQGKVQFLVEAIRSGLVFTFRVQHHDGSFDQAYPHEHSFGATGFLLPDLINAFLEVRPLCAEKEIGSIETGLRKAADFLIRSSEQHGLISNHLAGAALGLFKAGDLFQDEHFSGHGQFLLNLILSNQSVEGWFPEYGGADPGYQTLCMHYLAQIYQLKPSPELHQALKKSLEFLKYFAHPDGSFGGEYGSRRTEIYYPGGIALLASEFLEADCLNRYMLSSIEAGRTITLVDMDMGNTAPLLNSYILALDAKKSGSTTSTLPFQEPEVSKDFPLSGLAVRSRKNFYLILGSSNGGVVKLFEKVHGALILDDCGVLGVNKSNKKITTQSTELNNPIQTKKNVLECESFFYPIKDTLPNPLNYLILRLMNLTLMRIGYLNEMLKKIMVRTLIKNTKRIGITRTRRIALKPQSIEITDTFRNLTKNHLTSLSQGFKFTSIHMASARYFSSAQIDLPEKQILDHTELNKKGVLIYHQQILFGSPSSNRRK